MFLEIEAGLVLLALVLALTAPDLGSRWFEALERSFGKLARRRGLSVVVAGLTALALRAALLPVLPIPQPGVQDEFSYLLLSDTFAHGRLANPTNPMWVHFESIFVNWQPTHTGVYWPAQGLIMAFGQVVMGHPFWGIWLSVGLMCAAITWMLQGWIGEGWALLGGFLAVIRLGAFSYWADSYWGGAVAAIGGALVLGALPRLKKDIRVRHALLMGLGFAILANSRPYEGLFFGIPVAVVLLIWLWKMKGPEIGRALKRAVVPLLAVLVLTLVAMGYYFWRTTGSPFRTPYMVCGFEYSPVPPFPWQPLRPVPPYRHPEFRRYYLHFEATYYDPSQTVTGMAEEEMGRSLLFWTFYLSPVFTLPLVLVFVALPRGFAWRDISLDTRFLLVECGAIIVANMLPIFYMPHYTAPITCAILALMLIALCRLREWQWRGRPAGRFLSRAFPSICVLLLALRAAAGPPGLPSRNLAAANDLPTWCWQSPSNLRRAAILSQLEKYAGGQLVIVHYNLDDYATGFEWVYNRADLNSAKVIWARDMGPAENEKLVRYFKNRHVWLVDASGQPPKLTPYPEAAGLGSPVER